MRIKFLVSLMSKTEFNPLISDKNDFEPNHREVIMVVGIRVVGWLLYISYIKASIYELKFLGINTFKKSMKISAVNGVYLNSAKLNIKNGKNDSIRKNAACPEYAVIAEVLILSANAL